jgi:hypothetical protein
MLDVSLVAANPKTMIATRVPSPPMRGSGYVVPLRDALASITIWMTEGDPLGYYSHFPTHKDNEIYSYPKGHEET